MQNINFIKAVYLVGIGGIGMSALARYFLHRGLYVAGYDRYKTRFSEQLRKEHIMVDYSDSPDDIPALFKTYSKERIMIIYTPAVPKDNSLLEFFKDNQYHLYKRAEVLGMITRDIPTVAVAGTHGKTSVSVMTAWIMKHTEIPTDAFFGGISRNLNSNLMLSNQHKKTELMVAEADEFDRSFLHLHPFSAVITSADADHLDIYGNMDALRAGFEDFVGNISNKGNLVLKKGLILNPQHRPENVFTYALHGPADFYADNTDCNAVFSSFDLVHPKGRINDLRLNIPGILNMENAVAASALAILHGTSDISLRKALASWKGTQRRFEYIINTEELVFINDYAHHPKELAAFIGSVRKIYPKRKITGVFQPHLYSRTRDFADDFAHELSQLDELIMTKIYPAREEPIEGVSSQMILNKVESDNKQLCKKGLLPEYFQNHRPDVLLLMGAGDIDDMVEPIKNVLLKK